jgi:hypothetical protein
LCIKSSDWWANENEWSDSDGKRERSSVKVGDVGNGDTGFEWSRNMLADVDRDKSLSEGFLLDTDGMVGVLIALGCWRMRLSPDIPKPWSWSVTIELL